MRNRRRSGNLNDLRLDTIQLTGAILVVCCGSLQNLEIITLHSNQLTGTIPAALESLTALEYSSMSATTRA